MDQRRSYNGGRLWGFKTSSMKKNLGLRTFKPHIWFLNHPMRQKFLFLITSVIPRILIRCMHPKVLKDIRSPNTCVSNFRSKIGMNQCLIKRKSDF